MQSEFDLFLKDYPESIATNFKTTEGNHPFRTARNKGNG